MSSQEFQCKSESPDKSPEMSSQEFQCKSESPDKSPEMSSQEFQCKSESPDKSTEMSSQEFQCKSESPDKSTEMSSQEIRCKIMNAAIFKYYSILKCTLNADFLEQLDTDNIIEVFMEKIRHLVYNEWKEATKAEIFELVNEWKEATKAEIFESKFILFSLHPLFLL
ncbi:unnamed protein product [Acanthosepion pharaonis]|uniref:Uncharacterized protein n=1 Tax=Acanthosepion pharaonis TaxID=158019 RepID=A0A812DRH6_ACAPH|nr:unnamed protein product [Sepia pharaonis]